MKLDLRVYVITPDYGTVDEIAGWVQQSLQGGATCVQLRSKHLSTSQLISLGHQLRRLTRNAGATFIVNDRPDIAVAVEADGVHVGQDDIPVPVVRALLGPGKIIGVSVETPTEARTAEKQGATYLGTGPVYTTPSKDDAGTPYGPGIVTTIVNSTGLPVVGIGGIAIDNSSAVIEAGGHGVAVISAVFGSGDVQEATNRLRRNVDQALAKRSPGAAWAGQVNRPVLHFVLDYGRLGDQWPTVLDRLTRDGTHSPVDWVHLRIREASAAVVYDIARQIRSRLDRGKSGLIINDRCDVAVAVDAAGVQLPEQGLPVDAARKVVGAARLIGRSVHSVEGALEAAAAGADYVLVGHIFPSRSKPGRTPLGTGVLAEIVEKIDIPVIAIGGINLDNVEEVLATGCSGVAVIDAIALAPDPFEAARVLTGRLADFPSSPKHPFPPV